MSEIRATSAHIGLNMSSINSQKKEGELSFALNAVVEGLTDSFVTYQNESANILCATFPEGYKVLGSKNILEKNYAIFMLADELGNSEIGKIDIDSNIYSKIVNDPCIGFSIEHPIHKIIYKVTNCSTEIYWTDHNNFMRWLDLDNLPYQEIEGPNCTFIKTDKLDCNKLSVQPNFKLPKISYLEEGSEGELVAGTYQFGVQYSNSMGEGYTSFYGLSNPFPINNPAMVTQDFNYVTGKSITFRVDNIDLSGVYDFINIVVVKTINNIPSVDLVETRRITDSSIVVTYTGTVKSPIKLTPNEVFERFPIYEKAEDLFVVRDILGWSGLTVPARKNYQKIVNKLTPQWQSYKFPKGDDYRNGINVANFRTYMRDEVYALSLVFTLTRGRETDAFPFIGRAATTKDLEIIANQDSIAESEVCGEPTTSLPRWKVYNTATKIGFSPNYNAEDPCYKGEYEFGEFAYVESTDRYPCDPEIWGDMADKPIRHFRFPDSAISHIHDNEGNIYPIGVKIDIDQLKAAIQTSNLTEQEKNEITGFKIVRGNRATNKSVVAKGFLYNVGKYTSKGEIRLFPNYLFNDLRLDPYLSIKETTNDSGGNPSLRLDAFNNEDSKKRWTLHSPDTSFYQPALGNQLKLETVEFGIARGHFVETKKHAKYKLLSLGSYSAAMGIAVAVGFASLTFGVSNQLFDGTAAFTSFVALTNIIERTIPRINYAYQHNAVGEYESFIPIGNDQGYKIRNLDIAQYLLSGLNSASDIYRVNNFQRESSVYLRATTGLPFPHEFGAPVDESKWTLSSEDICSEPFDTRTKNISSLYASIKRRLANQYGTINSYELIDTGFHRAISTMSTVTEGSATVFGGDIFISKFAFKRKMPFFIDNRVGFPDDSDVFYNEIPNVAYPTYWMSTDSKADSINIPSGPPKMDDIINRLKELFGVKINNFDCRDKDVFYQDGKFYLAAYSIPVFFCESEVNVDFRQAYDGKEGDFYPHVGESIPDEWLQEVNVPIAQDNTYTYNKTFSKQNKESSYTTLPLEYKDICETQYPNKIIYSDVQDDLLNYKKNNWLVYRPVSQFDLPLNYGKLISVEGVEDRAILARFENKSLLYNAMMTIDTSSGQAAYLGNSKLFGGAPALDFAESELGYNGTQNKFFLRTHKGHLSVDAKRGKVFLIGGNNAIDITDEKTNMTAFFKENLPFRINRYFPEVNTDNHFNGIGLHGVFDDKYDRAIITKLDYAPLNDNITYRNGKFWLEDEEVSLDDPAVFCNKSFTVSFNFKTGRWISFHSYIPNFYVGATNKFFSGRNEFESIWTHNEDFTKYNSFYGVTFPYILQYPFSYKVSEEILQSVKDNTRVLKYINNISYVVANDVYFNKAEVFNDQQHSGVLELINKPKNNPRAYIGYPKHKEASKEILFTKAGNFYNFNQFWDVVKDETQPIFLPPCGVLDRELNEENMNYKPTSHKKYPIRGKDANIRLINDATDKYKFLSEFLITKTQPSYI